MFARLISHFPVLPVFGPEAQLQPVFVGDAAAAIATILSDPGKLGGKTYELGGPEVITMLDLNRRIAAAQGRKRLFVELPDPVSAGFATLQIPHEIRVSAYYLLDLKRRPLSPLAQRLREKLVALSSSPIREVFEQGGTL